MISTETAGTPPSSKNTLSPLAHAFSVFVRTCVLRFEPPSPVPASDASTPGLGGINASAGTRLSCTEYASGDARCARQPGRRKGGTA
jgi:hypothetical protein